MCGIKEALETSASTPRDTLAARVDSMTDTLTHRVPDDRGVWVDDETSVGRGFRRLARARRVSDEHRLGRRDRRRQLCAVLMFQAWLESVGP